MFLISKALFAMEDRPSSPDAALPVPLLKFAEKYAGFDAHHPFLWLGKLRTPVKKFLRWSKLGVLRGV